MKKILWLVLTVGLLGCVKQPAQSVDEQTESAPVKPEADSVDKTVQPKKDTIRDPVSTMLLVDAGGAKAAGELGKAIEYYKGAIEMDANNDAAHYELASVYAELDEPEIDSAILYMQKAVDLDPANEWYKTFYGRLLINNGETEKGLSIFKSLTEDHPEEVEYQYDLAFSYEQAQKFDQAIEVYEDIESTYGFDPQINYHKHKIYFAQEKVEEGIAEIEEIIENNPEYITYSAYLANFFYENNNYARASEYVNSILSQAPNDPQGNSIAAKIAVKQGEAEKAEQHLTVLAEHRALGLDQKIQLFLPFVELIVEKPETQSSVINAVGKLVQQYPDEAKSYALLGDFLSNAGLNQQSIQAYEKSTTLDKSVYMVWEQLILLLSDTGNFNELARVAADAQTHFPDKFLPYYMAGFANYQVGNHEQSAKNLEKALDRANDQKYLLVEIYSLLGDAYHGLGNFEKSNTSYDEALLRDPDNKYVLNNYSYYLAEREENLAKARKMSKRALELNPNDVNTKDTHAWVLFQSGQYQKALELLKEAYNQNKSNAVITEHLGDAYFKVGEKEKALRYWKKAESLQPASEILQKKIKEETFFSE